MAKAKQNEDASALCKARGDDQDGEAPWQRNCSTRPPTSKLGRAVSLLKETIQRRVLESERAE